MWWHKLKSSEEGRGEQRNLGCWTSSNQLAMEWGCPWSWTAAVLPQSPWKFSCAETPRAQAQSHLERGCRDRTLSLPWQLDRYIGNLVLFEEVEAMRVKLLPTSSTLADPTTPSSHLSGFVFIYYVLDPLGPLVAPSLCPKRHSLGSSGLFKACRDLGLSL